MPPSAVKARVWASNNISWLCVGYACNTNARLAHNAAVVPRKARRLQFSIQFQRAAPISPGPVRIGLQRLGEQRRKRRYLGLPLAPPVSGLHTFGRPEPPLDRV